MCPALLSCPALNQSISCARARTQALLGSATLHDVRLRMSLEQFSSPCPQLSARPKISFVATRAAEKSSGRQAHQLQRIRARCEFCSALRHMLRCAYILRDIPMVLPKICCNFFCFLALAPLVCIARICRGARWLSFPMNNTLPAPYSTRDTTRFCGHRHAASVVVLNTSGVLKELLSSVHLDMLHGTTHVHVHVHIWCCSTKACIQRDQ